MYAVGKKYAKVKGTIDDYLDQSIEVGLVYYHHNNLGSTRVMTNQDGEKVFDQDYLPFGGDLPKAGQLEVQNETGENYKYTGQKEIASIGLYYYSARYYDPAIGRFTRQDSYRGKLKKPQSQHLYIYVLNNPLKLTDPTGNKYKIGGSDPVYGKSMYNNKVEEGLVKVGGSVSALNLGMVIKGDLKKIAAGEGFNKPKKTTHMSPEVGGSLDIEIGEGSLETNANPTLTRHFSFGI